jgi:hypothetical protein
MPLTSRSSDISRVESSRIKSIFINDVSGSDTGGVTINLIKGGVVEIEPVTSEINYGVMQVLERVRVQFDIPDIMAPNTGQFVYELTTKIIPRVKITNFKGTTIVLDSGNSSLPAMTFTKRLLQDDNIWVWRIEGIGYKSNEADLNTTV